MNYSYLRKLIDQKTKKLIENENWDDVLYILKECPEQIYFFSAFLEEKLKGSKDLNEFPVLKIIYENNSQDDPNAPFVYYRFRIIFDLIFEMVKYKSNFLSEDFKDQLCKLLYPKIADFLKEKRNRISSIDIFIKNFFVEIQKYYHDDLINHYYILGYLIKEKPEYLVDFFPLIVSKGLYQLGYDLIVKFNELIIKFDAEVKKILENIILHEKQYHSLREILEKENRELIKIMEGNRKRLKNEFYNRFINYTRETIENDLLKRDQVNVFDYTFDMYTDEELTSIIYKIIELEITYSNVENRLVGHNWVQFLLLLIGWAKKSYLFNDYLEDIVRLGHLQVVETYFMQFPEKINKYKDFLFEKIGFYILDLLRWHYDDFKFKDPTSIYRKLLFKDLSADTLTLIFFNKHPELIDQFKEIIKEYINIKLKEGSFEYGLFYKLNGLLRIYHRAYKEYNHTPSIDLMLLKENYEFFISKSIFKEEEGSYIHDLTLARNFHQLDEKSQEDLINQLIKSKNLSSIEFLINYGYKHMERYLLLILTFEPKHELQSEHFIKILEKIIRESGDKKEIQEKVKDRLKDQIIVYKTAEIYSFLGDFKKAEQVLEQIMEKEVILSYSLNSFIDYQLVHIESSIICSSQLNISERTEELAEIENDFNAFNTNQNLIPNFKFKFNSYKARINLYEGFSNLRENFYQKSKISFKRASEIYRDLRKTKIKPDNKKIFNVFYQVSEFFSSNIMELSRLQSFEELNKFIHRKLISSLLEQQEINSQMKRFLENIKHLEFGTDLKLSSQLVCEIPTKFCPIPPKIIKKLLLDDNNKTIIEWDKTNVIKPKEMIKLSMDFQKFFFILEFEEKGKSFDFDISFNTKSNMDIQCEDKRIQAGRICYELLIRSKSFTGQQKIELIFAENEICGYKRSTSFCVTHYTIQKIEDEIIDKLNSKIKKYKGEFYNPTRFKIFLEQFKDPEIRFYFLKNIIDRLGDYYYTIDDMTQDLVKQIKRLPFRDDDELIFIILNQLNTKSQMFWTYFLQHYLDYITHKIEIKISNKIPIYLSKYTGNHRLFLIFIEDIIGTGRQFIKFYKNDFQNQYEKLKIQKNSNYKFYLVAGIGSEQSFDFISKNSILSESHIRYSRVIRENEKAFNKKNWDSIDEMEKVKDYLQKKHPMRWCGYRKDLTEEGLEYLVVLEWNTPNNTIGCLYKKNDKWNPLFLRT